MQGGFDSLLSTIAILLEFKLNIMNKYEIEYWYLNFVGEDDMGYDTETIELEANTDAEAIAKASRMTRGKNYKIINKYNKRTESKYKMMLWSMIGLIVSMLFIVIHSCS